MTCLDSFIEQVRLSPAPPDSASETPLSSLYSLQECIPRYTEYSRLPCFLGCRQVRTHQIDIRIGDTSLYTYFEGVKAYDDQRAIFLNIQVSLWRNALLGLPVAASFLDAAERSLHLFPYQRDMLWRLWLLSLEKAFQRMRKRERLLSEKTNTPSASAIYNV